MAATNYKTVFRLDYKPTIGFYDSMFSIAAELPDYPDWVTNGLSITLSNYDDWCSFFLAHNSAVYIREIKKENERGADDKRIRTILDVVMPMLEKKEYQRVGLRCWSLCPVEMAFDQLVTLVTQKFLADNKEIRDGICPSATDAAYSVHFVENNLRVALRTGPMRKDEIEVQFVPNKISNVPVKKRGLPPEELYAELPDVSLLIDIDVSKADVKDNEVLQVYGDARNLQDKLSHNIAKYVFGLKA